MTVGYTPGGYNERVDTPMEIKLTQGVVALLDDEDYKLVSPYKWYAQRKTKSLYYAMAHTYIGEARTVIAMHRAILNPGPGELTDHINGNGLDNRRVNLRVVTSSQNSQNRGTKQGNKTSQYKGVHKYRGRWNATIETRGTPVYLGAFDKEEDAARAYDEAATKLFGEYARLNFPTLPEPPHV